MLLLASRGLFIGLIAVAAIVVILCVVLSAILYYKSSKVKKTLDADVIRKELYRRETDIVIQIFKDKPEESKKEALVNELRRIKSAELLVDEIVKNEKSERGIVENHPRKGEAENKKGNKPHPEHGNGEKAGHAPAPQGEKAHAPAPAHAPAEKPAEKPVEKSGSPEKSSEKPTEN